jgi:hypothetical protein
VNVAGERKLSTLSIVLRTVDKASADFRKFNQKVERSISRMTAPFRRLGNRLSVFGREGGLPKIADGFSRVGQAAVGLKNSLLAIGVAAGLSVGGLLRMVAAGDKLKDTAERLGVSVDSLAQLRFAAKQTGVDVEQLDGAMETFSKNLGQARAGTGRMAAFLKKASPEFLRQVKNAKSTEEAFLLVSKAMAKLEDPAKRAALATAAFGDANISLLLKNGPDAIKELMARYAGLAGSQEEGANAAAKMDDAMNEVSASFDGLKAGILTGLAPAFLDLSKQLTGFFAAHRGEIGQWVSAFGKWLPGAVRTLVSAFRTFIAVIKPVWNLIGGVKGAAIALSLVLGGKLIVALAALGKTLLTTPFGLFLVGITGLITAGLELRENWNLVKDWFSELWDSIVAKFEWALGRITAVMDKVSAPARWLASVGEGVGGFFADVTNGTGGPRQMVRGTKGLVPPNLRPPTAQSQAHVTVDFNNAPKGTRAKVDPESNAAIDVTLGYQLVTP